MAIDLKQTIRDRGLTQREVARQMGVSEPTLSHWIAHTRDPERGYRISAEAALVLARVIEVAPHALRPDIWDPPMPAERQCQAA